MPRKEAHLALISDLIDIALSDNVLRKSEYAMIQKIAHQYGLDDQTVKEAFQNRSKRTAPVAMEDRLAHFHLLLELVHVDGEHHVLELERLKVLALGMGIAPTVVLKILDRISGPQGSIPTLEELTELCFQKQT